MTHFVLIELVDGKLYTTECTNVPLAQELVLESAKEGCPYVLVKVEGDNLKVDLEPIATSFDYNRDVHPDQER